MQAPDPPADSEASEELEAERLGLSHGAESTVEDLLRVELDGASREVEPAWAAGSGLGWASDIYNSVARPKSCRALVAGCSPSNVQRCPLHSTH